MRSGALRAVFAHTLSRETLPWLGILERIIPQVSVRAARVVLRAFDLPSCSAVPPSQFLRLVADAGPDEYVSVVRMNALWNAAYEANTHDETLGLRVAAAAQRGDFGVLEYLMRTSATPGQALEHFVAYSNTFHRGTAVWDIQAQNDTVRVKLAFRGPRRRVHRWVCDFIFATLVRQTTATLSPERVLLQRPSPDSDRYREAFGVQPEFGQPVN